MAGFCNIVDICWRNSGVHHRLHLQYASGQCEYKTGKTRFSTHHIRVIRIQPHVTKRIQPRHRAEPHMTVQLRKWIVWVLPRLHRWQGLWRRVGGGGGRAGSTTSGASDAFDHVNGVRGLDPVRR